ncbi:MAG: DUF4342 domain-containing protein [Mahellales bacterium]|jgi:hypothetical protein
MEDLLEKMELVKAKTGVSYTMAKEALDNTNGNVVDAILYIENKRKGGTMGSFESFTVKGAELLDKLKDIIHKGNISRIRVRKDEKIYLDIPVTAGAISVLLLPKIAALGAAIALLAQCTIEVERNE